MKIAITILKVTTIIFGVILVLLMMKLVESNKQELKNSRNYTVGISNQEDRKEILNTLGIFQEGYFKRDVSKIDYYIEKTIDTQSIIILGTNPSELFIGKEGVKKLFYGDWKFWGNMKLNLEEAHISQIGDVAYIITRGDINIDIWKISFPIRLSGIMSKEGSKWLINKLQFQYDLNTNYIIFSMIASILTLISSILLILSLILNFGLEKIKAKE